MVLEDFPHLAVVEEDSDQVVVVAPASTEKAALEVLVLNVDQLAVFVVLVVMDFLEQEQ
jgi:hypothetical protein